LPRASVWKLASPRDALFRVAPYITARDLQVFAEVAGAVLGATDPRYDLPSDERWYAPVTGQMPDHSEYLGSGLSETMMALAIFGGKAGLAEAPATAASIVRALLDGADARRWWSAHRHLELFAEAAPEAFLDAVEASLAQNDPAILALFTDDKTPVTGGIYYADLLWGLERQGWSSNYLSRVASNLSDDREQQYFADGITEDLTADLSRLANMFVAPARHHPTPAQHPALPRHRTRLPRCSCRTASPSA